MCLTDKRKRNPIRKQDRIADPVWPPGRVEYEGASHHISFVLCLNIVLKCRDINYSFARIVSRQSSVLF